MITIQPAGDPHKLEPLTCLRSALDIEVAGSTLHHALVERWLPAADERNVSARGDFWPSRGLIEKLRAVPGSFTVKYQDIEVASCGSGGPVVTLDEKDGSFLIVYPWHILAVNEDALAGIEEKIEGTVRERVTVDGTLVLGEGSVILPGVYIEGIAVIGRNCKVGPNCYIRGTTYLADNCHVGQAVEIKNSILMTKVAAGHLSYIGDSIICPKTNFGAGTVISNFRHDGKNHRSMIDGVLVDTGRRKFGAILGDGVHTGIHSSIYPGRKLWPGVSLRPGTVVQSDLHEEKLY